MIDYYWSKKSKFFLFLGLLCLGSASAQSVDTLPHVIQSEHIGYMKTPDGRDIRYAHWQPSQTSQPQAILILQGRASFIEKHSELVHDLLERGYEVFTYDLAGQGRSSRLLNHPQKGYIDTYETYLKDTHQLIHKIIRTISSKPLVLFGSSLGGHIALRYGAEYPEDIEAIILESPMLDIPTKPYPRWVAKALMYGGTWMGLGDRYAPGYGDFNPQKDTFEKNNNTRDKERFMRQRQYTLDYPNHVVGGPTFGWVKATFDSIEILHNPKYLTKIKAPVLLFDAGKDNTVLNSQDKIICSELSKCQLITYPDAYHHIVIDLPEVRAKFWADFKDFMTKINSHSHTSFVNNSAH